MAACSAIESLSRREPYISHHQDPINSKRICNKLVFEQLRQTSFLGVPSLDIWEGRGVRMWIEKLVRGGKKNTEELETTQ